MIVWTYELLINKIINKVFNVPILPITNLLSSLWVPWVGPITPFPGAVRQRTTSAEKKHYDFKEL